MIRERVHFDNRRYWAIAMNEARQLYIGNYYHIDSIYHLIRNFCMKYRFCKYCHSPILLAVSIEVVGVYCMYPEVAEGDLDHIWKEKNFVDFWTFYLLFNKMIKYNLTHRKYAGNATMIPATHHNQATR